MSDGGNPLGALLSFWMFLKLIGVLASLMGGIYALYCLSRVANGVHRVADALESWPQSQNNLQATQVAAQRNLERATSIQQISPVTTTIPPPISNVPPAPLENTSSTQSVPTLNEHDVRPRSDSF